MKMFIVYLCFLGGTDIKVYDAFMRGRLLAKITQHHKTVTCLKATSNGYRILSGSLDKHVKIYDSGTYKTLHTLDYPNAVLSVGISVSIKNAFHYILKHILKVHILLFSILLYLFDV